MSSSNTDGLIERAALIRNAVGNVESERMLPGLEPVVLMSVNSLCQAQALNSVRLCFLGVTKNNLSEPQHNQKEPMKKTLREVKRVIRSLKQRHFDKFIFIHINKTGGSSVERALKLPFEHKTALEKIEEIGRDGWDRKLTFTVVRNPWDKVVSHYHYRVKTNKTNLRDNPIEFKEWVKRAYGNQDPLYYDPPKMFMPQVDWITDENGKILVDEIIHLENIDSEFKDLLKKLGRNATLPHVKKSNRGNYKDYYDQETKEIVRAWFEKDIERFDYKF